MSKKVRNRSIKIYSSSGGIIFASEILVPYVVHIFCLKKKTNFVFVFVLAGLRHRARQLNLDSEDETDIISTTSYEERIHVRIFRTISRSLVAIYTSILYYIALSTSTIKDTFSRYFLRRTSYSSKVSSNDRAFWIPWSPDKKYTSAAYFSGEH